MPGPCPVCANPLTRRQLEILILVARGQKQQVVADTLGLSIRTVKNPMAAILIRLRAANTT